ncbi:MAG: UTP--glucose-1-phosphate uridylyltransferase [Tepidiformaceae bacterium]
MPRVSKALILAAGLGTRLLPATKAVPKEMLPVVDKPLIQYAVEEAVAAGLSEIVFVVADGKEAIAEHFGHGGRVEQILEREGRSELVAAVRAPATLARFHYRRQAEPLGIAHAIQSARDLLEGEPFALLFPDDVLISDTPVIGQLLRAFSAGEGSIIAVQEVADSEVPQYGIVDPEAGQNNPARLRAIVEKPGLADAPSRLGVVGRYILGPTIFAHIDRIPPGKNGELQLTDALASQIAAGETVSALTYEGTRYDTGRPLGLIAANVGAALARGDMREQLADRLRNLLSSEPS